MYLAYHSCENTSIINRSIKTITPLKTINKSRLIEMPDIKLGRVLVFVNCLEREYYMFFLSEVVGIVRFIISCWTTESKTSSIKFIEYLNQLNGTRRLVLFFIGGLKINKESHKSLDFLGPSIPSSNQIIWNDTIWEGNLYRIEIWWSVI